MKINYPYETKIPVPLLIFITICFISLMYACRKDFLNNQDATNPDLHDPAIKLNVALAQQYYEELKEKQGNVQTTPGIKVNAEKKPNKKHISFKKGYSSETPYVSFVEAPLRYDHPITTFFSDDSTARTTAKEIIGCIFDRIIIYKSKKTGKINQRIVTYIPSKAYLQKHNNDAKHNTVNNLDKDFNGFMMYKKWDGTPLFALKIKDGRTVSKIILSKKNKTKTTSAPITKSVRTLSSCHTEFIDTWYQWCTTTTVSGGTESYTHCDAPYIIATEAVQVCDDDGSSGGSENNGDDETPQPTGGGGPQSTPPGNPCDQLKTQNTNATYKSKVADLKNKTDSLKESGFELTKSGTYNTLLPGTSTSNSDNLNADVTASTQGFEHTHLDDYETGKVTEEGLVEKKKPIKMFSPADVNKLMELIEKNKTSSDYSAYFVGMVSSYGHYTIKFNGTSANIKTGFNTDEWKDSYIAFYKKERGSDEKKFLRFLKEKMKVEGIELYKIRSNGSGERKLLATNSKGKPIINTIPCPQ